ncbi:bifunctional (p)ppGpp synthetase/guanosine-3',5'-bis(diphosphate) 3'-pyrophosphohydrolase [Vibrio sp. HA2012]|uniref:HD domain-containing protein n=1 Tax=Vibrio sp. HA2012 TaxID=1971595 RepID=UPI000C2B61E8|nr:HD domain-containing protein [Vibrio sp. HA2012]PJC87020.1 bifunctional (p)ppGpp synthetase/guanosine-3',5'-bis(diphosphate) 3'-pyrophosphohydrolase [Vibrio sp. HA2012]
MSWQADDYLKAWYFAARAHGAQTFKGQNLGEHFPYCVHLGSVAMEVMSVIVNRPDLDGRLAVQAALLHDTLEDTDTKFEDISDAFGRNVANGVLALTKNTEMGDKQAQMADSLERIKQQPKEIWLVKLCDRITNLSPPPFHWNEDKILGYRNEAQFILDTLGTADKQAAERLAHRISTYGVMN